MKDQVTGSGVTRLGRGSGPPAPSPTPLTMPKTSPQALPHGHFGYGTLTPFTVGLTANPLTTHGPERSFYKASVIMSPHLNCQQRLRA